MKERGLCVKKQLLIIDDNPGDRELIQEMLFMDNVDLDITQGDSGENAIESVKGNKPDIAILDTNLPGIDGFETCRRLRELYDSDSLKIIIMTGLIDAVDAGKAKKMGADDYCVKTIDCSSILEAIKQNL